MKTIEATVVDARHLELMEALPNRPGERLRIVISSTAGEDEQSWHSAAHRALLDQYAPEDSIYDKI